ncbi:MAG: hypothetical protein II797_00200, partial [Clostridia bacterium]|nr:hypothetical protein [Clostridia bacterium]
MRKTKIIRFGSLFILCLLLIAFTVCSLTGCKDGPKTPAETSGQTQTPVELGSGAKTITFEVQFADGSMHVYKIHTDKTILADALLEHNLVSGTTESYGLYVKT